MLEPGSLLDRGWRTLGTWLSFTLFGLGGIVISLTVFPLLRLVSWDRATARRRIQGAMRHAFRLFTWFMAKVVGVVSFEFRNWERLEGGIRRSISIGKYVTWLSLAGGTDLDSDLPEDRYFSLGGSRVLPAFQHDELRVSDYWVAEASFLRRLKVLSPIKNQAIYAGLGLQYAGLYDRLDVEGDDDQEEIPGGYLFLAGPTALGTFTLGVGFTESEANVWLSIGKNIASGSILDDGLFR